MAGSVGGGGVIMPKKKFYRQRAHANPFSDHQLDYPNNPEVMRWDEHFSEWSHSDGRAITAGVEILDIGCGFGGLLVSLAPLFSDSAVLGLEIRNQVAEYVRERIRALRRRDCDVGSYQNVSCIRANSMKFLPNFFFKGQISKIFICFPDPHFKVRKHKARIVTSTLNSEYAYVLRPGGIVYTITDVEDLHFWMVAHFDKHPLFQRMGQSELDDDKCVEVMCHDTEEAKKVARNKGKMYIALFRRQPDPPL